MLLRFIHLDLSYSFQTHVDLLFIISLVLELFNCLLFVVFFPFLVPLLEALEVNFFAKDAQGFFKHVTQQTMEARRESGQVRSYIFNFVVREQKCAV